MGVKIIDPNTTDPSLKRLVQMVHNLAQKGGLPEMPEVGIFNSPELNAFATGPSKSNSLVAVSSGLINRMPPNQLEGVLGHEISHIANGDMVTMTLLQGIVNAFVMFFARVAAFAITSMMSRGRNEDSESSTSSFGYQIIVFVLEMVFMILGSMVIAAFSRYREFRADKGGAHLAGSSNMIGALQTLQRNYEIQDDKTHQPAFQAMKISSNTGIMRLFASHPPLEERIARLKTIR